MKKLKPAKLKSAKELAKIIAELSEENVDLKDELKEKNKTIIRIEANNKLQADIIKYFINQLTKKI